ncbi:hypothetical protein [Neobacillus rhizophilus]|uniref:Uncharacterized protein n=1 Tax=Neobacillus rhizophilus TaxID=2833579 RepID=A0A942U6V9_9BACI|nr:hypothetical protein [Neobacillus rhizophilus]MBS4215830.1 hypothetical protein [Neobacillus rhizophilus]
MIEVGRILFIYLFGYLFSNWIWIPQPFVLADFFIGLITHPFEFLAASLALFFGVLLSGGLIKEFIHMLRDARKKHLLLLKMFELVILVMVFLILFQFGWEQALVFFCLSIVYGTISLES